MLKEVEENEEEILALFLHFLQHKELTFCVDLTCNGQDLEDGNFRTREFCTKGVQRKWIKAE